jgi:hypothetical protein
MQGMREVSLPAPVVDVERESFRAPLATILELPLTMVPELTEIQDPATGWRVSRWLGGLGLGLMPVGEAASFAWPGPWLARIRPPRRRPLSRHAPLRALHGRTPHGRCYGLWCTAAACAPTSSRTARCTSATESRWPSLRRPATAPSYPHPF